jgi:hypothetical protein
MQKGQELLQGWTGREACGPVPRGLPTIRYNRSVLLAEGPWRNEGVRMWQVWAAVLWFWLLGFVVSASAVEVAPL